MKDKLKQLLTLLITLLRTQPDEEQTIADQKAQIAQLQDEISTIHGDDPLADPEIQSLINDASTIAADATPHESHVLPTSGDEDNDEDEDEDNSDQSTGAGGGGGGGGEK